MPFLSQNDIPYHLKKKPLEEYKKRLRERLLDRHLGSEAREEIERMIREAGFIKSYSTD